MNNRCLEINVVFCPIYGCHMLWPSWLLETPFPGTEQPRSSKKVQAC